MFNAPYAKKFPNTGLTNENKKFISKIGFTIYF